MNRNNSKHGSIHAPMLQIQINISMWVGKGGKREAAQ
jgi:hypothetical protein